MDIVINDKEYKRCEEMTMPAGNCFHVDEHTDPYQLVEDLNEVLSCFGLSGLRIERIIKSGKGCHDTPYYFKVTPISKLKV